MLVHALEQRPRLSRAWPHARIAAGAVAGTTEDVDTPYAPEFGGQVLLARIGLAGADRCLDLNSLEPHENRVRSIGRESNDRKRRAVALGPHPRDSRPLRSSSDGS